MLRMETFPVPENLCSAGPFWTRRPARRGTVRVFLDDRELVEHPTATAARDGLPFHFTVTRKSYSDSLWIEWHPNRIWRAVWMRGKMVRFVYEEPDEPECPYRQDGHSCEGGPVHLTGNTRSDGVQTEYEWACSCRFKTWWSYRGA